MKKLKFQNLAGPLASPAFRPRFLGPCAENQDSATNIFFALCSCLQKGKTRPPCLKTLRGDRFGRKGLFQGPKLLAWS